MKGRKIANFNFLGPNRIFTILLVDVTHYKIGFHIIQFALIF